MSVMWVGSGMWPNHSDIQPMISECSVGREWDVSDQ